MGAGVFKQRIYKNEIFAAIHGTAEGLHAYGVIDKTTMREFDKSCLAPVKGITPDEIRAIRKRERLSQPVFARYLNVSKNLVSDWERGVKKPGGPSLRLLSIVKYKGLDAVSV
ncbi:MAG: DNA-binding transcriptional regulator [Desulfovibrio sp.]|nr:DNA-binding transcriptional regulator [Desulfovibrio sp.]